MIEMTLGFLFDRRYRHVLLIKKRHPEWQAGLYNGVGGKFENVDQGQPFKCMCREAEEELGIYTIGWRPYCVMEIMVMRPTDSDRFAETKRIHVFAVSNDFWFDQFEQRTDEKPQIFKLDNTLHSSAELIDYSKCIPNLCWLLQMAQDTSIDPAKPLLIQYA